MTTVLEKLVEAARKAAEYNSSVEVAPSCILWTDGDRQFEEALPLLRAALPELLTLGEYDADKRMGPAIWLRCALGGTVDGYDPKAATPIVYLPGVSRSDFRLVETLPENMRPLAYYAYRGAFFQQRNGKDWTALAFLVSKDGGLGLSVSADMESKASLQTALPKILESPVETLGAGQLDAGDFDAAIVGGDTDKLVLLWLDGGDAWRKRQDTAQWKAFLSICKKSYSINPEKDGVQEGLRRFAGRVGAWKNVFERYAESPFAYPQILPNLLLVTPPAFGMFDTASECGGWPQWNDEEELRLLDQIKTAAGQGAVVAQKTLEGAEKRHGDRRGLVWAKLGRSPLAGAIEELVELAMGAGASVPTCATLDDLSTWYEQTGWRVDNAARQAVAKAGKASQNKLAVMATVRGLYRPWLEKVNAVFQDFLRNNNCSYPRLQRPQKLAAGDWCVFADGLRLDVAKELRTILERRGLVVSESHRWVPVPTVTACGKPCAVPGARGPETIVDDADESYDPLKAGGTNFAKYLEANGFTESHSPKAGQCVWCANGDIDTVGHDHGEDMPLYIAQALDSVAQCVEDALAAGAKTVRVVTDHGWLWLPGAFAKYEVPTGLTTSKSMRFATLKAGVTTDEVELGWSWKPDNLIAFAPGVCCHKNGLSYVHGGLSLQECRIVDLSVTRTGTGAGGAVALKEIGWRGVRFTCTLKGDFAGCRVDFRMDPMVADSLVQGGARNVSTEGSAKGLIAEEDQMGQGAYMVVLDAAGNVKAQNKVHIGGVES